LFSSSLPKLFTLASLLIGAAAAAQSASLKRAAPRTVVITVGTAKPHDIRVAPGFLTTLLLDAPIERLAVEVEGRDRFSVMDAGDQLIGLMPESPLGPEESLTLRARYRAGSPEFVEFRLIAAPAEVDTVVTVNRPQEPTEACQAELLAARQRCEAQEQELEQLKAWLPATSPAALGLAGLVDKDGVKVERDPDKVAGLRPLKSTGLTRMRAAEWAVVVLHAVRNSGQGPWAPTWAEFTPMAGGPPRKARALLPLRVAIAPGEEVRMAIEVEMPQRDRREWLNERYSLTLCDGARHCLTIQDLKL
jgi:uncharacterized protein (TIGR02268 family)